MTGTPKPFVLALALVAVLLAGCRAPEPQAPPGQVELDVFSGRPNPRWNLTQAQAAQLRERLVPLGDAPGADLPGHLGFRGFDVVLPATATSALTRVHVYSGTVWLQAGGSTQVRADPGRELERWLLGTVDRAQVDDALLAVVSAEVGPGR